MNVMQMDPTHHGGASMLAMGTKASNYTQSVDAVSGSGSEMASAFSQGSVENGMLQDGEGSLVGNMTFHGDLNDFNQPSADPGINVHDYQQQNYYNSGFNHAGFRHGYPNNKPLKPTIQHPNYGIQRYPMAPVPAGVLQGGTTPTLNQLLTQGQHKYNAGHGFGDFGAGTKQGMASGHYDANQMWQGHQQPQRGDMYPQSAVQNNQASAAFDARCGLTMPPSYPQPGQFGNMQLYPGTPPVMLRRGPGQGHRYPAQDPMDDSAASELEVDDQAPSELLAGSSGGLRGHIRHSSMSPSVSGSTVHGLRTMPSVSPMPAGMAASPASNNTGAGPLAQSPSRSSALDGSFQQSMQPPLMMPASGNQMMPSSGNQMMPASGNQMMPASGNQMMPASGNQMMPASGNQMMPASGNQMMPASGNQMMPASGNQMMSASGNQMMPASGNQMMPPPPAAGLNAYGKMMMPMGMNSQQLLTQPPSVPMMPYGQQQQSPYRGIPQHQQGPVPVYGQYPFEQVMPHSGQMFGQPGMHPGVGYASNMVRKTPQNSNGPLSEMQPQQPHSKKKSRKDASIPQTAATVSPNPGSRSGVGSGNSADSLPMPGRLMAGSRADSGAEDSASPCWPVASATVTTQKANSVSNASSECLAKLYAMGQEPERRPFLERVVALMDEKGTPISTMPQMSKQPLDLFKFYLTVKGRGGFEQVSKKKLWKEIGNCIHVGASTYAAFTLKKAYLTYLLPYECKYDRNGLDPHTIISAMEAKAAIAKKNSLKKKEAAAAAAAVSATALSPTGSHSSQQDTSGPPSFRPPSVQSTMADSGLSSPPTTGGRDDSSSAASSSHGGDPATSAPGPSRQSVSTSGARSNGEALLSTSAVYPSHRGISGPAGTQYGSVALSADSIVAPVLASPGAAANHANNGSLYEGGDSQPSQQKSSGTHGSAGNTPSTAVVNGMMLSGPTAAQRPDTGAKHGGLQSDSDAVVNGYGGPEGWQQQQQQMYYLDGAPGTQGNASNFGPTALPYMHLSAGYPPGPNCPMQQHRGGGDGVESGRLPMPQPGQQHFRLPMQQQLLRPQGMTPAGLASPHGQYNAVMQVQGQGFGGMPPQYRRDSFAPGAASSPRPGVTAISNAGNDGAGAALSGPSQNAQDAPMHFSGSAAAGSRFQNGAPSQPFHWGFSGSFDGSGYQQQQQLQLTGGNNNGSFRNAGGSGGWNDTPDQQQPSYPPPPFGLNGGDLQMYEYPPNGPVVPPPSVHPQRPVSSERTSTDAPDMMLNQPWMEQQQRFGMAAPSPEGAAAGGTRLPQRPPSYPMLPNPALSAPPMSAPGMVAVGQPEQRSSPAGSRLHSRVASRSKAADAAPTPELREPQWPPGCVEATQPKLARRRKVLCSKDVGQVEPGRLMMSLKSGLLAESSWALDTLNVLLHDDAAVGYFSLVNLPGLLDAVIEHYAHALSDVFLNFGVVKEGGKAMSGQLDDCTSDASAAAEGEQVDSHRLPPRCPDYTWKTCTGLGVCIASKDNSDYHTSTPPPHLPPSDSCSDERGGQLSADVCLPFGKALSIVGKAESALDHVVSAGPSEQLQGPAAFNKCLFYGSFYKVAYDHTNVNSAMQQGLVLRHPTRDKVSGSRSLLAAGDSHSNTSLAARGGMASGCGDRQLNVVTEGGGCSATLGRRLPASQSLDDEPFLRDDAILSGLDDHREAKAARCLCIANIIRSLSFIPGNEKKMSDSTALIVVLGSLLHLHWKVDSGGAPNCGDWWWSSLDELREDALVTVSNISGQLDLSSFDQDISQPLLESLLFWATCRSAYARDPFAAAAASNAACTLSPQMLAVEAMCKMCVHAGNVDLLLATPPWWRIVSLFSELVKLVGEAKEQALREFAIVLISGLVLGDSGAARAVAMHEPGCVSLLLGFLETAEHSAMLVAQNHGINMLRDNPETMGTSLDMIRRVAALLAAMSQVPENRPLFHRHQGRLLNLVMSQILDQHVARSLADVLFECTRP